MTTNASQENAAHCPGHDPWRHCLRYNLIMLSLGLLFAAALFLSVAHVKKNPPIAQGDEARFQHHLDAVDGRGSSIKIIGWAFVEEQKIWLHSNSVILSGSDASYVLPTKLSIRKDVADSFVDAGLGLERSGFFARGFKLFIPRGAYRIFIDHAGKLLDTGQDVKI